MDVENGEAHCLAQRFSQKKGSEVMGEERKLKKSSFKIPLAGKVYTVVCLQLSLMVPNTINGAKGPKQKIDTSLFGWIKGCHREITNVKTLIIKQLKGTT